MDSSQQPAPSSYLSSRPSNPSHPIWACLYTAASRAGRDLGAGVDHDQCKCRTLVTCMQLVRFPPCPTSAYLPPTRFLSRPLKCVKACGGGQRDEPWALLSGWRLVKWPLSSDLPCIHGSHHGLGSPLLSLSLGSPPGRQGLQLPLALCLRGSPRLLVPAARTRVLRSACQNLADQTARRCAVCLLDNKCASSQDLTGASAH